MRQFNKSYDLFYHLLQQDTCLLEDNLRQTLDENHPLFNETLALINAHVKNQNETLITPLIAQQADGLLEDNCLDSLSGQQVGVYQLIRKVGQGGMSVVYLAERNDGELEQTVAIKFIFPSVVQAAGNDFLNREAQHLANLKHPNIAQIHTVGRTENGMPYLVMEYIQGLPIDQYCEQNGLALNARLALFKKVCQAVYFAHSNMVIHADIKPSNILIDSLAEPKLMDFGIAANLNEQGAVNNIKAVSNGFSSPEQSHGEPINAASDVFSLGKLLETLTRSSYRTKDIQLLIDQTTKLDNLSRVQSVNDLLTDIARYLQSKPISLRQSESCYKLLLFTRRKPAVIISLLLILGFCISTVYSNSLLKMENHRSRQLISYFKELMIVGEKQISKGKVLTVAELAIEALEMQQKDSLLKQDQKMDLLNIYTRTLNNLGLFRSAENFLTGIDYSTNTELSAETLSLFVESLVKQNKTTKAKEVFERYVKHEKLNFWEVNAAIWILEGFNKLEKFGSGLDFSEHYKLSEQSVTQEQEVELGLAFGESYLKTNNLENASKLIEKIIKKKMIKPKHLVLIYQLSSKLSFKQNSLAAADSFLAKAEAIIKTQLGHYHPLMAVNLKLQSELKYAKGEYDLAYDLLKQRPVNLYHYFGKMNVDIAQAWIDVASFKWNELEYSQSHVFLNKAKSIYLQLQDDNKDIINQKLIELEIIDRELQQYYKENRELPDKSTALNTSLLLPYRDSIVEEFQVSAVAFPSNNEVLTIGKQTEIVWDARQLTGEQISIYVARVKYDLNPFVPEVSNDLDWFRKQSITRFATNIPNNGRYQFDPSDMKANGKGLRILLLSDQGHWSLSPGTFKVNSGLATDNGLRSQLNPLLLTDAIASPASGDTFYWGKETRFHWNSSQLLGNYVTLYVLHDDPTGLGNGTNTDIVLVNRRRWYPFLIDIPNTGTYSLDPALMNGRGTKYKLLLVTNAGYWSVSDGQFSIWEDRSKL